jgi:diguanylate cyclase (GGDEF)-like protein
MLDNLQEVSDEDNRLSQLIESLQKIKSLGGKRNLQEILECIIEEASNVIGCEHIFLSRYDAKERLFKVVAWNSSITPVSVSLEQKFMADSYLSNQRVMINDLSSYNYRLRPAVARMGLFSMAGIPLYTSKGLVGVLEAFSSKIDYFSKVILELLALFSGEIIEAGEKADRDRENKYLAAEMEFLSEIAKWEQDSTNDLLYKLGETFAALLNLDGIVVFGIDERDTSLQEVMTQGFSVTDIGRLRPVFNKDFLKRLEDLASDEQEQLIVKQPISATGVGEAKLLYIMPIAWRKTLSGVLVFYCQQESQEFDLASLEQFVKRIMGHLSIVLEKKELYSSIQRISFTDPLTDLANRRAFDYVIAREFKKVKRSLRTLSLLMIDIDHFKRINDRYGHLGGDFILEQFGTIMRTSFRSHDMPVRYGGEEFAVILPDTDIDSAMVLAEKFRIEVSEKEFYIGQHSINITVSIGISTCLGNNMTSIQNKDDLIKTADYALYQAKEMGRNLTVPSVNR